MAKDIYPSLIQVWPSYEEKNDYEVEIIAVHGLAANPETTWLSDGKPRINWLTHKNMLPAKVPRARIWTFNFQSNWYKEGPLQQIQDLAISLIEFMRQKLLHNRPIVFLAHSFGGIVVAAALESCMRDRHKAKWVQQTTGVVFLGTPFHGSREISHAKTFAGIADAIGIPSSTTLLDHLIPGSPTLEKLTSQFKCLVENSGMDVVCFYEQVKMPILKYKGLRRMVRRMIVPEESACLVPNGTRNFPLNTYHTKLNEFESPDNGNFQLVSGQILNVVLNTAHVLKCRRPAVFHFPYESMPSFSGREDILKIITDNVQFGTGLQKRIGLHGLGGMGKTQIVTKYVHTIKEDFVKRRISIFFVGATNFQEFFDSYIALADSAGIQFPPNFGGDKLQIITNWLQDPDNGRWLMILDNADDPDIFGRESKLSPYIPTHDHGAIIVTSRVRKVCTDLAGGSCNDLPIFVDKMKIEDCRLMLANGLNNIQLGRPDARDNLIYALDCVPIILSQAIAFIRINASDTYHYLQLWKDGSSRIELQRCEMGGEQRAAQQKFRL